LLPGASFSRRFDQPGTYDYNCSVHPYMTGRVVVRAQ
jgi:plastocyanin